MSVSKIKGFVWNNGVLVSKAQGFLGEKKRECPLSNFKEISSKGNFLRSREIQKGLSGRQKCTGLKN